MPTVSIHVLNGPASLIMMSHVCLAHWRRSLCNYNVVPSVVFILAAVIIFSQNEVETPQLSHFSNVCILVFCITEL